MFWVCVYAGSVHVYTEIVQEEEERRVLMRVSRNGWHLGVCDKSSISSASIICSDQNCMIHTQSSLDTNKNRWHLRVHDTRTSPSGLSGLKELSHGLRERAPYHVIF